jgi:hypothetical protein
MYIIDENKINEGEIVFFSTMKITG